MTGRTHATLDGVNHLPAATAFFILAPAKGEDVTLVNVCLLPA